MINSKTKNSALASFERTRDIFETFGHYKLPPQIPILDLTAENVFRSLHMRRTRYSEFLLWVLASFTGFRSWYKKLPSNLDSLLKTTDVRGALLHAPVLSASIPLRDDPRPLDVFDRAVTLVVGAQQFYHAVQTGELPPDTYRDAVLDMSQYPNLFATSLTVDNNSARIFKSSRTDQMAVVVANHIYIIKIDFSKKLCHSALKDTLKAIAKDAQEHSDDAPGVGLLTAMPHHEQLKIFKRIQKNKANKKNIEQLRHCFLTLCLDVDAEPRDYSDAMRMAHIEYPENRWYWSSLQIVVFANAKASVICNFSTYIDGNTMMRSAMEIQKRAEHVILDFDQSREQLDFAKYHWSISPQIVERARKLYLNFKDDQPATFTIPELGRKVFHECDTDPVAAFVIALQMTANALIKTPPVIHQFLAVTKYRFMDLETAIVSTAAVTAFCDYIKTAEFDPLHAKKLLRVAISSQREECREKRAALSIAVAFAIFRATRHPLQKIKNFSVFVICYYLLHAAHYFKPSRRDIVISHPALYEEAPLVGRPGAKLPYVTYFALHYQMWDDETILTMMPGLDWTTANKEFVDGIARNLRIVLNVASSVADQKIAQHEQA